MTKTSTDFAALVLGQRAYFKAGAEIASDVALAGAVIASDQSRHRERRGKDGDDHETRDCF